MRISHIQAFLATVTIGLGIIIQPCQSFLKQFVNDITVTGSFDLLDLRRDSSVRSWTRKDVESVELAKDQSVRKLLDMLNSRSISSRQAKKSFESILTNWQDFQLSEIGWHRLLDGAIRWRYPTYAISSFEIMTEQGIVCPAYLMTSLLQLVCISGLQDTALSIFDAGVAAGLEPSVHCFSPLLKSCGTAQKARELLQRMEFVGIQANVISYTAAIKSCENTGDWRSALELLDLMRASGITANEITYCCAINVASRGNAGDVAINILREMLSLGFPPNLLCYGSALTGCAKVGMWYEVEILLKEMEVFGIPLQESIVISVLNVCRGQYSPMDKNQFSRNLEATTIIPEIYDNLPRKMDNSVALHSTVSDIRSKITTCQWARTLWLIENYGLKATNVTESMYTMAMDVCESGGRYREVIATYHLMIAHQVQPSKSSFSFALRACAAIRDGEETVRVIRGAQKSGTATPFMFNSTLVLLDSIKRNDMAVKVLKDIVTMGASTEELSSARSGSLPLVGEHESIPYHTNMTAFSSQSRMRLPPAWLTRRIISSALQNLTENFATYFTEVKNGRLSPSKYIRPFVSDTAEVLKQTVQDRNLYLAPSAYPMANKILLDCEDFETLQMLLNHTLYKVEVNSTRLYDFALKSLLKDSISERSIDLILSFIGDIVKAVGMPLASIGTQSSSYASLLLVDTMERVLSSKISVPLSMSDYPLSISSDFIQEVEVSKGAFTKKDDIGMNEIVRANLLLYVLEEGKKILSGQLPQRAYTIVALACKKANLPTVMLNLYRLAQEDNNDDKLLRNIIVHTLARSKDHWDVAIEILEDMKKKNLGTPDLYMYYSALTACDSGHDWEQAIFLLSKMQQDGHALSTVAVTTVITACAACGQADEALSLLAMMEDKDIPRTVWTYNAAISACAKKGNWKGALSVFEKMRENSLEIQNPLGGHERIIDLTNVITDQPDIEILEDEEEEEEEEDAEEEEEEEEEGWDERLNPNFDLSRGLGDYELNVSNVYSEGVEEVSLFHSMRGIANQVTYNTLIEALGEGGQLILVDELYREAVENNIVNPLLNFKRGWIDLHGHSVHMAKAAIRYTFEHLLALETAASDLRIDLEIEISPNSKNNDLAVDSTRQMGRGFDDTALTPTVEINRKSITIGNSPVKKNRELAVIVGKGAKLVTVIQQLLMTDFHPLIRSVVSKHNSGRLLLSENDICNWLTMHKSLR